MPVMSAKRPGIFPPVREHLVSDRASHVFKHQQNSEHCRASCSVDCFHILDHAPTSFQLKVKEAIHIQREQPSLNQQLHHVNLKLSYKGYNFHIVTFSVVSIGNQMISSAIWNK